MKTDAPIVLMIFGNERCVTTLVDLEAAAKAIHSKAVRESETSADTIDEQSGHGNSRSDERFDTYEVMLHLKSDARGLAYAVDPDRVRMTGEEAAIKEFEWFVGFAKRRIPSDIWCVSLTRNPDTLEEHCVAEAYEHDRFAVIIDPRRK